MGNAREMEKRGNEKRERERENERSLGDEEYGFEKVEAKDSDFSITSYLGEIPGKGTVHWFYGLREGLRYNLAKYYVQYTITIWSTRIVCRSSKGS